MYSKHNNSISTAFSPAKPNYENPLTGLDKNCADKVINVITDYNDFVGSAAPRGTVNYYMNANKTTMPGCPAPNSSHQMSIQYFYASWTAAVRDGPKKLTGDRCFQTNSACTATAASDELSPSSGNEVGCFCVYAAASFPYV